jgi:hypothetical protein
MYFEASVPRCVESVFNTYVIMLCYDFKVGGIRDSCQNSRFAGIVRALGFDKLPISNWDIDLLQNVMLDAIKKKKCSESELGRKNLEKDERPWFVMQDKGDMMTSVAFLYNYLVFFALENSKTIHET